MKEITPKELIEKLKDKKNIEIVGKEIADFFIDNGSVENIDVDYYIQYGKMQSGKINTHFRFNSEEGSLLYDISQNVKYLLGKEYSEENNESLKKCIEEVEKFELNVKKEIFNHISDLRSKVRTTIPLDTSQFPEEVRDKIKEIYIPLQLFRIEKIEFNFSFDKEEDGGYTLTVRKNNSSSVADPIASELINEHIKTGESYDEILKRKKKEKDKKYKNVEEVIKKYYESEIYVGMYIDYSPRDQQEAFKRLEEVLPNWKEYQN